MRQNIITYTLLCVAVAAMAVSCSPGHLVILHTNDTHSQIEPVRVGRDRDKGGVERRLQYINSVRKEVGRRNVLLLDAGDYNQGTPYFTVAKGDLEIELMNALGYDVATLGNHEFDNGQEELARRLSSAEFVTVTCNYDFSDSVLKDYVKPYTIVRRAGLKIGIIGVTSYLEGVVLKSHIDGLVRMDPISEVNKWADWLKHEKKCDLVILLSHFGHQGGSMEHPSDILMAQNSKDIDIIIGGHSHTFLKNAVEIENLVGRKVVITQCGGQGVIVGRMDIPTPVRP